MDYAVLETELRDDPQSIGYQPHIDSGNHNAIVDLLKQDDPAGATGPIPVQPSALREYAAGGLRVKIDQGTSSGDATAASTCRQLLDFMVAPNSEPLVLTEEPTKSLFQNLVTQKIITSDEEAALKDRFSRTLRREEAVLGQGVSVDHTDVATALS